MKIVYEYPPNIKQIREVFGAKNLERAVYTYGSKLYVPKKDDIPEHLMTHEQVHEKQQKKIGKDKWWDKFLTDEKFRLEQEIEAYGRQMHFINENYDRPFRRRALRQVAADLSSGLYGKIIAKSEAKELIKESAK